MRTSSRRSRRKRLWKNYFYVICDKGAETLVPRVSEIVPVRSYDTPNKDIIQFVQIYSHSSLLLHGRICSSTIPRNYDNNYLELKKQTAIFN